ncbi:reverse transcriptase domain-containing protein [Tanacetum coccineum]
MDKAFKKQIGINLEVYVDDFVIKSHTEQEILRDIEETFQTLRRINMKLNLKKCTFGVEEGMFLGNVVNMKGIKACPKKAEAVIKQQSLKMLKNTQSLNGKLASLNRFLSKSAKKSLPLFKTLKICIKKSDFQWTLEAEKAFQDMKQCIEKRMLKWKFELEAFDITYRPRTCIRGQILADFITKKPYEHGPPIEIQVKEAIPDPIRGPGDWLRIAKQIGVQNLEAKVGSRLVANQIHRSYIAKEQSMIRYLEKARALINNFKIFSIEQVPRSENKKADALSKIASTSFAHLTKQVLVEVLKEKTIEEREMLAIVEEEGYSWMAPLLEYLTDVTLPAKTKMAQKIKIKARFGLPMEIISYNKKQFRDNPFKEWCENLNIKQRFASFKHPQTNKLVERANRSLREGIKARLVVIPVKIGMTSLRYAKIEQTMNDEALLQNLDIHEKEQEKSAIQEAKSKANMERYYNAKVHSTTFKPGDFVYRSNEASHAKDGEKLGPKWEGSYEVVEALKKGAYKISNNNRDILLRTWNVKDLKKCYL